MEAIEYHAWRLEYPLKLVSIEASIMEASIHGS